MSITGQETRGAVTAEEKSTPRWHVGRVYRHNAGGSLYAPVDKSGNEYGVTPSYDGEAVQRFVNYLNGRGAKFDFTPIENQRS